MVIPYPLYIILALMQVAFSCIPLIPPPPDLTDTPTAPKPLEQKETDCVTVELNPGRPCVFPFTYQYKQHTECLPFKDKFWCALTPVYDKKEWGYCDQSLCPLKGETPKLCGTNPELVATHLIAEKNWPYLSVALNQTGHPNPAYKTDVFEVATENGDIVMTSTNCPVSDPGLVSLFISPSTVECNAATLGASSTNGLHHLMVSTSCDLDAVTQKFISDKDKFKKHFNGVPMKLCGTRTWMKSVVAESRKTTLMDVFSFLYNTAATADRFDLDDASDCKKREDTVKTLTTMFSADNVGFLSNTYSGTEEEGLVEISLERTLSTKIGIAFVETQFESETNPGNADVNDIVPYSGLVTFPANSNSGSIFITIVKDEETETYENFEIVLMYSNKRMDDGATGANGNSANGNTATVGVAAAALQQPQPQPPVQPLTRYNGANHHIFDQLHVNALACFPLNAVNGNRAYWVVVPPFLGNPPQGIHQPVGPADPLCLSNAALGQATGLHAETQLLPAMLRLANQANQGPLTFYLYTYRSPCYEGPGTCQEAIMDTILQQNANTQHRWFVGFKTWYSTNPNMPCPQRYARWCTNMIYRRTGTWPEYRGQGPYALPHRNYGQITSTFVRHLQFVWFGTQDTPACYTHLLTAGALQHHQPLIQTGIDINC